MPTQVRFWFLALVPHQRSLCCTSNATASLPCKPSELSMKTRCLRNHVAGFNPGGRPPSYLISACANVCVIELNPPHSAAMTTTRPSQQNDGHLACTKPHAVQDGALTPTTVTTVVGNGMVDWALHLVGSQIARILVSNDLSKGLSCDFILHALRAL